MVEYLCIIQARVNSTRLPSKVMLDLAGKTLLERVYESVSKSKKITKIVVATSNQQTDDIIELKLNQLKIDCYRGDLNNVLKRFYDTSIKYNAKNIIRITADNPLTDGLIIDKLIQLFESKNVDYSMFSNAIYGLTTEIFTFESLKLAYCNSRNDFDKEHVTPYIKDNSLCHIEDIEKKYRIPQLSATVDTLEDYIKINKFYLFCLKNNYIYNIDNYIIYNKYSQKTFLLNISNKTIYDKWNKLKQNIEKRKQIHFSEREIIFVSMGQNIGFEQYGKGEDFLRPVVVIKKFNKHLFLGIPLSSKIKDGFFFHTIHFKERENSALLLQSKIFDSKRIKYRLAKLSENEFNKLVKKYCEVVTPTPDGKGSA